jgi:hypothetical protein
MYDRCVNNTQPEDMDAITVKAILDTYQQYAGNREKVKVFSPAEVSEMVNDAADTRLDKSFLDAAYADVSAYREVQKQAGKKK